MAGDSNIAKNLDEVGTYIFVPVYNVAIDPKILGKEFHGFDIISTVEFFNKYVPQFQKYGWLYSSLQLDWSLQHHLGVFEKYPVANFLIRTGAKLPHFIDQVSSNRAEDIIDSGLNCIENYIMTFRLYKAGHIQIERYYAISSEMSTSGFFQSSTVKEYIVQIEESAYRKWNIYKITQDDVPQIVALGKKLNNVMDIVNLPMQYFMEYYNAKDNFDKILKLVTIWECTLLNDCSSELNYRLKVRGSKCLKQNLSKFFQLAYGIRCDIVHTGEISNKIEKQLRAFLNADKAPNLSLLLLVFVRDYMEPITRKVLLYFVEKASETHQTLEQIAEAIDSEIFETFEQS